jgi:diaminohydroxyphosphoribosylaminopyrimidine deaminase/5-amino-6-(5-phosphoribosylamino)uracil reductase
VTLEPCNHTGRTGPCTDALLAAGVRRVVWGLDDPDPVAAGGGSRLRAAGVATTGGVLAAESADLNRSWVFARRHGRPYVTWKVAGSLDGRVAAADGTSRWISSPAARAEVHRLRAQVGAVLAGTGSVLVDDAQLAVRDDGGHALPYARQPLRVVLGRRPLPRSARVLDGTAETLQLADHDPHAVLQVLAARRIHHVLLEGGPTVAAAFWRAGVVDEVIAYLAPLLLGPGPPLLADLGVTTLADAPRLEIVAADLVGTGPDTNVRITAHPDPRR